jgi:hypothetical protein
MRDRLLLIPKVAHSRDNGNGDPGGMRAVFKCDTGKSLDEREK